MTIGDSTLIGTLAALAVMIVTKLIDYAIGRAQEGRAARKELRDELQATKDELRLVKIDLHTAEHERDEEVKRRREIADQFDAVKHTIREQEEKIKTLSDERDEAETASRMGRKVAETARERLSVALEKHSQDEYEIFQLKSELRSKDLLISGLNNRLNALLPGKPAENPDKDSS